jgi:hypothetical protein
MSVLSQITCDCCDRSYSAADWDGEYLASIDAAMCAECVYNADSMGGVGPCAELYMEGI